MTDCTVCSFPRQWQLPSDWFVGLDCASVERARCPAGEVDAGPPWNGDGPRILAKRKISGICRYRDEVYIRVIAVSLRVICYLTLLL